MAGDCYTGRRCDCCTERQNRRSQRDFAILVTFVGVLCIITIALAPFSGRQEFKHHCDATRWFLKNATVNEGSLLFTRWKLHPVGHGFTQEKELEVHRCTVWNNVQMGGSPSKEDCAENGFYSPDDYKLHSQNFGQQDSSVSTSTGFHFLVFRGTGHGTALCIGIVIGVVTAAFVRWAFTKTICNAREREIRKAERGERAARLWEQRTAHSPMQPWDKMAPPLWEQPYPRYILPPLQAPISSPPPAYHTDAPAGRSTAARTARLRAEARHHNADLAGTRVTELEQDGGRGEDTPTDAGRVTRTCDHSTRHHAYPLP